MRQRALACLSVGLMLMAFACGEDEGGSALCDGDTVCEQCGSDPWCYHHIVVAQRDSVRCANITLYWGSDAVGVEGNCYYEIAMLTSDCSLCDKITKADIAAACVDDVCNASLCGNDALCAQCGSDPWCYHDALVDQLDSSRCGNITEYWGSGADGVEGSCFNEIARSTDDCALCAQITKSDIRSSCELDVC